MDTYHEEWFFTYNKGWDVTGLSQERQYSGQVPLSRKAVARIVATTVVLLIELSLDFGRD